MARNESQTPARERANNSGSRSRPSWLSALVGFGFLVVAGFGVGMVAGVVWEDPSLVYAYVTGQTEEVDWDAGLGTESADAPVDPQVLREASLAAATAVPADKAPAKVPAPPAAKEPPPTPAPVAAKPPPAPTPPVAAAPSGGVSVQVGAFGTSEAAEQLAKSLRAKGFDTYVSPGTAASDARWRVRVGPIATREQAEVVAKRLKKSERLPTWILSEDAE